MGLGVGVGPTGGVPRVTLSQEHVPVIRRPAIAPQPSDRLPEAILALREAQISRALSHPLHLPRPAHTERSARTRQAGQHGVPAGHGVRVVADGGPAFLEDDGLVLDAEEGGVVVLDVAALELDGAAAVLGAEDAGACDGACDAGGAVGHGEVAAALVETVDDVLGAGADDGVVVVGGVGG